jgi:hypothetical protein
MSSANARREQTYDWQPIGQRFVALLEETAAQGKAMP